MVTNEINFEELEQKTSAEFVQRIKDTVDNVNNSEVFTNKEIQFLIEEEKYTLSVLICFSGNVHKYEYRFSSEGITCNRIGWVDISNFFDIPLKMKKIKKTS